MLFRSIVPLGLAAWFRHLGIDSVVELGWWQTHQVRGVDVVLTPAHHWSARGLWDRRQTLWGGFAVYGDGLRLIYTGDTGYAPDFAEIRERLADRGDDLQRPGDGEGHFENVHTPFVQSAGDVHKLFA